MREYKINMDRPDPTPEEIARNKDFSKVLNKYSTLTKPVYTKSWFLSTVVLVIAAGILILVNLIKLNEKPVLDKEQSYVHQPAEVELIAESPFINPPMDGVDIEYHSYLIDAGEKTKLNYESGTKIKVPKNAFIDASGNDVEGDVEIKYREFHDVADFFASGIPMDYDSAGTKYHFESAGMLEIHANKDGVPVFLKEDKEIKIEMASDYDGTKYNLYKLDEENKKWSYRGKDQVIPAEGFDERPSTVIAAAEVTEERVYKDGPTNMLRDDTLSTEDYYYDKNRPTAIAPKKELSVKNLATKLEVAKVATARVEKTEPNEPVEVNPQRYNFDIAVDPKEFPEIALYDSTRFEIGDENKNFSTKMYDINWEDVLLEEKEPGVNYNLTLIKGETKYTWVVYPVFEGENYENAKEVFEEKFDKYKQKLDIRIEEEKVAKEKYEAELEKYEALRAEQLATWKEQKRQYDEAVKLQSQRRETQQKVTRAFSISSFGTWNCDSPIPRPKGRSVSAKFTDGEGNLLAFGVIYLVQKDKNAMFTYTADMFNKLKFNPKEKNVLWGVTSGNRLAIFHADRFSEIPKNGGKYEFKMEVLKNKMGSVAEIRQAINVGNANSM